MEFERKRVEEQEKKLDDARSHIGINNIKKRVEMLNLTRGRRFCQVLGNPSLYGGGLFIEDSCGQVVSATVCY